MNKALEPHDGLNISDLLVHVEKLSLEPLQSISALAREELVLESALLKMQGDWETVRFQLNFNETLNEVVLGPLEEIQCVIDDQIVRTHIVQSSVFIESFVKDANLWSQKLQLVQDTLDTWQNLQHVYLRIAPVFSTSHFKLQMPEEVPKFQKAVACYKEILGSISQDTRVLKVVMIADLLERFRECNEVLRSAARGLNVYLDEVRSNFPRAYFLADDELLTIIKETGDAQTVAPHIFKFFPGVSSLEFSEVIAITGATLSCGHVVDFPDHISTTASKGRVELWLDELEHSLLDVIKDQIDTRCRKMFVNFTENGREISNLLEESEQVAIVSLQIWWAREIQSELSVHTHGLQYYVDLFLASMERLIKDNKAESSCAHSRKWSSLFGVVLYLKDILLSLIANEVTSPLDFDWVRRIRFRLDDSAELSVDLAGSKLLYEYEPSANNNRLVLTSLTERCFISLFSSVCYGCFGIVAGPPGAGKTETVTELANLAGRHMVVTMCVLELDLSVLGRIMKGLAVSGAWLCLDRMENLSNAVFSALSSDIVRILECITDNARDVVLEDKRYPLRSSGSLFGTFTTGTRNFGSHLPMSLEKLLRPISCTVPDARLISQVELAKSGFDDYTVLASKLIDVLELCSSILSSCPIYDFGLRAAKSIISCMAEIKSSYAPAQSEMNVLKLAISNFFLPRIISLDREAFENILKEIEGDITVNSKSLQLVRGESIKQACDDLGLSRDSVFCAKTREICESLDAGYGLVIVGDASVGKSAAINTAKLALDAERRYENIIASSGEDSPCTTLVRIFSGSMSVDQLLGERGDDKRKWVDGVITEALRSFGTAKHDNWLVLDGSVNVSVMESLSGFLDCRRQLSLNSGERISLPDRSKIIFEVDSVVDISPSTIGACRVVHYGTTSEGWLSRLNSWIRELSSRFPSTELAGLRHIVKCVFPPLIEFMGHQSFALTYPCNFNHLIDSYIRLHSAMISEQFGKSGHEGGEIAPGPLTLFIRNRQPVSTVNWLVRTSYLSLVWSLGAAIDQQCRTGFDLCLRTLAGGKAIGPEAQILYNISAEIEAVDERYRVEFPTQGCVYDYFVTVESNGMCNWQPWSSLKREQFTVAPVHSVLDIIIPTAGLLSCAALIPLLTRHNSVPLLSGPNSAGKSTCVALFLQQMNESRTEHSHFGLFESLDVNQMRDFFYSKLQKRKRNQFGPPPGSHMYFFIDDLQDAVAQQSVSGEPIELLRSLAEFRGWHDYRQTRSEIEFVDISIALTRVPRYDHQRESLRFARHCNVLSLESLNVETMHIILASKLNYYFSESGAIIAQSLSSALASATLGILESLKDSLLPSPTKPQNIFDFADAMRIMKGVLTGVRQGSGESEDACWNLWSHECIREFCDRHGEDCDRLTIFNLVWKMGKEFSGDRSTYLFGENREAYDVVFSNIGLIGAPKNYALVNDVDELDDFLTSAIHRYNASHNPLHMISSTFEVQHVCRVSRILGQANSHGLLVGKFCDTLVNLVLLSAFILGQKVVHVRAEEGDARGTWEEHVKGILREAGELGKPCTLVCTHSRRFACRHLLRDLCHLIRTGELGGLFDQYEEISIVNSMRLEDKKQPPSLQTDGSPEELYRFFVGRLRSNLHVIIAHESDQKLLQSNLIVHRALTSRCSVNFVEALPVGALQSIAFKILKNCRFDNTKTLSSCVSLCQQFHSDATHLSARVRKSEGRAIYVTPHHFLEFVAVFKNLYSLKHYECNETLDSFNKLEECDKLLRSNLEMIEKTVISHKESLSLLTSDTKKTVLLVEGLTENAKIKAQEVISNDHVVSRHQERMNKILDDCQTIIKNSIPEYKDAVETIEQMHTKDILRALRSLKSFPTSVKLVMEAFCVLTDETQAEGPASNKGDYSSRAKFLLDRLDLREELRSCCISACSPRALDIVREKFINNPEFVPKKIKKFSLAALSVYKFVVGIEKFHRAGHKILPTDLYEELLAAKERLDHATRSLVANKAVLQDLEIRLSDARSSLMNLGEEKARVELSIKNAKYERTSLEKNSKALRELKIKTASECEKHDVRFIPGDVAISAATVIYLGPYDDPHRQRQIHDWLARAHAMGVACTMGYTLRKSLEIPHKVLGWKLSGLPEDNFAVDNGIIISSNRMWPLLIDPDMQANRWIRSFAADSKRLRVVRITDKDYLDILIDCVVNGDACLLEDVEEYIPPILDPLLLRQTFSRDGQMLITLGERTVQYSKSFDFYITTRLSNPTFPIDLHSKVCIVDFRARIDGLTSHFKLILAGEGKSMAYHDLLHELLGVQRSLKSREEHLTNHMIKKIPEEKYVASSIDLVEGHANIQETRLALTSLHGTLQAFEAGLKDLHSLSEVIAELYFCISSLRQKSSFYAFGLEWFDECLRAVISRQSPGVDGTLQLKGVEEHLVKVCWGKLRPSLDQNDLALIAFLLSSVLMRASGEISFEEWQILLAWLEDKPVNIFPDDIRKCSWISEEAWRRICVLSKLTPFADLPRDIFDAAERSPWKALYEAEEPETVPLRGLWSKITSFQRMLIIISLRPDRVKESIERLVRERMGHKFMGSVSFDLPSYVDMSSSCFFLIAVTHSGFDSLDAIKNTAEAMRQDKPHCFPLCGVGDETVFDVVEQAIMDGGWVILENFGLASKSWVARFCALLNGLKDTVPSHSSFRLWLICKSDHPPPEQVIRCGLVVRCMHPLGLKEKMKFRLRSVPMVNPTFWTSVHNERFFAQIAFRTVVLHSCLQERRACWRSWPVPYRFGDQGLQIALRIVQKHCTMLELLVHLLQNFAYSGEIATKQDSKIFCSLAEDLLLNEKDFEDNGFLPSIHGIQQSFIEQVEAWPEDATAITMGLQNTRLSTKSLTESGLFLEASTSNGRRSGCIQSSMIRDLIGRLPESVDVAAVIKKYPSSYLEPLNDLLAQEVRKYNGLLKWIRKELDEALGVIEGHLPWLTHVDDLLKALAEGSIPLPWKKMCYPTRKSLGPFVTDLVRRLDFFSRWARQAQPKVFWIAGFWRARSFITALVVMLCPPKMKSPFAFSYPVLIH